jgi:dolichyl-phosphate-mannose-protein mannosyltransferase
MRKHLRIKSIVLLLTALLILSSAGCSHAGKAVITNSDFEQGKTDSGGITGWQRYDYYGKMTPDNPYTQFSLADTDDGGKALCIENMQPNDARLYQHIDASANTKYKITASVKTEGISAEGAGANISVKDFAGTSSRMTGTKDWTTQTVYVDVWDFYEGFDLCLCLGGYSAESTGKAYFDNITIEEVDEIPEGADSLTVWDPSDGDSDSDSSPSGTPAWLNGLFKVLFFGAIAGTAAYTILISKKKDKLSAKKKLSLSETRGKPDRRDWMIMGILTVLTAVISFVNLGSTKAASNYWKAQKNGEYVIAEFDETVTVERFTFSSNIPTAGTYVIYYEDPDNAGEYLQAGEIEKGTFFEWSYEDVNFTAKRIKVVAEAAGLALNEIAFFNKDADGNWQHIPITVTEESGEERGTSGTPGCLFDEQEVAGATRTYMNGTYFDEIYFPRTAYEHIHGLPVYETTHPPLGKIIISLGIRIFGMNPFGWRFMGTLFGVMLVPVMYLFALKIFKKRLFAFTGAFLMMFDFMRYAQSRLATIDTYSVMFVMLMYYFMYDYFTTKSYDLTFKQSLKPLAFCGLSFGIGIACKWTSMYAGAGLAFLFFLAKFLEYQDVERKRVSWPKEKKPWILSNFAPTCAACLLFFIIIPSVIYVLSYIPYMAGDPDKGLLKIVLDNQLSMYDYHSNLNATHDFSSTWWQWPVMVRPIWYYVLREAPEGIRSTIVAFGNPAVWWTGIAAVAASMVMAWRRRDKKMAVVFVAFAMQFCPWMLVDRCTFIYHFFTSVPFIILMIVYCISCLLESKKLKLYNGVLFVTGTGAILGAVAIVYSKARSLLPLAIILVVSSLAAYLLERYSEEKIVCFGIPVFMAVGAAVSVWLMPCLVPIFAAMMIASCVDFALKWKHKEFRGMSILICYLALVLGLFVSFYPALSGMEVSTSYIESLKWFGSWYF